MNNLSFWGRNEGELIGAMGGLLIAFIAAYLTYFFSTRQARKKERDAYQGLLYTLHVELYWQNNHFDLLKPMLEKLKIISVKHKTFVLESPPMQFNLSNIETGLLKAIEYKYYNHEIVALLISYLNQVHNLNLYLDLRNANVLLHHLNDKREIEQRIYEYFNVLNNEYINKTQPVISDIRKMIENELKDYPKNKMVCSENCKTISNKVCSQ